MHAAHTTYQAELGAAAPGKYRSTPKDEADAGQLLKPGTVISTSYGTGPYVVLRVMRHVWKGDGQSGPMPYHSVSLCSTVAPRNTPEYWINELVAVDGRILHLFENNTDEVLIMGTASPSLLAQAGLAQLDLFPV